MTTIETAVSNPRDFDRKGRRPARPMPPKAPKEKGEIVEGKNGEAEGANRDTGQYRRLRKWTTPKLAAFANQEESIRARLGTSKDCRGPLTADELITYLEALEQEMPEWRLKRGPTPDGKPRKRGRPRKNAKKEAQAPELPVVDPSRTLETAKDGGLMPRRKRFVLPSKK